MELRSARTHRLSAPAETRDTNAPQKAPSAPGFRRCLAPNDDAVARLICPRGAAVCMCVCEDVYVCLCVRASAAGASLTSALIESKKREKRLGK